jgi:hypothetical protein
VYRITDDIRPRYVKTMYMGETYVVQGVMMNTMNTEEPAPI